MLNSLKQLQIPKGHRGAIVGQTGTGKSVLARNILPKTGNLIIVDPKGMFDYPDMPVYTSISAIKFQKPKRFIFRYKPNDFGNIQKLNEVYKYAYDRGNTFVYTDDVIGIMDKTRYPKYLAICYQMGRQKNVTMLSTFQRPAWLPLFLMTECDKFYLFRVTMKEDINRINQIVGGYSPDLLPNKHCFLHRDIYNDSLTDVVKLTI